MPKRKRDFDKRRLGYVLGSLNNALDHAFYLKEQFDRVLGLEPLADDYMECLVKLSETVPHAKYALLLQVGMMTCNQALETFRQFAMHAWGVVPEVVERWTNTGQDWKESQQVKEED